MDYELFFETMVENTVGRVAGKSMVDLVETTTLDYETELCLCGYDVDGKRTLAIAVAHEGMGIDVIRIGINPESEIYYDTEQEEILTRNELFESWKEQVTDENESFSDYIRNAISKNGTLERIY